MHPQNTIVLFLVGKPNKVPLVLGNTVHPNSGKFPNLNPTNIKSVATVNPEP